MMEEFTHDDAEMLDRLVDGRLDANEYVELLLRLESLPDGWRRCALAFLETQAWRQDMGALRRDASTPKSTSIGSSSPAGRIRTWQLLLAVAASFLIALGLGNMIGRRDLAASRPVPDRAPVVTNVPVATDSRKVSAPADNHASAETFAQGDTEQQWEASPDAEAPAWEIPVYDWAPQNAWRLTEDSSAIPPQLIRVLEALGTRVQRQRNLLPLETEDGRQVVVPIERVEITPVGWRQYR
jgi:hypothetical protein